MNMLTKDFTDAIEAQFGKLNKDIADALKKANVAEGIAMDLEQKMTRPAGPSGWEEKSYGQQVAEDPAFIALQDGKYHGRARIELKAITSAPTSGGGAIWSDRDKDMVSMARRSYRVRDLLTVVNTTSGSIDYTKQTLRTNNAAPVAEGNLKPYSNYGWTKQSVPVRTIAHLAKISRQAMDDSEQLVGEIDTEMRYGLQLVEDAQLLYGDNTGENLYGMMPQASAFALPDGFDLPPGLQRIDMIGAAVLQQSLTDFPPDGIVMHPADWMAIRLTKDAAGGYLFGPPGAPVDPVLFGLPVATTQAIVVNHFLVGGFRLQKMYDRLAPEVLISSENTDDFEKNMLTLRCEERVALAVRQAGALVKGTFA